MFKPIPVEGNETGFICRPIRRAGEGELLAQTARLLAKFDEEGGEMRIGEMQDLVAALHRTALQVQRVRQAELIKRFKKMATTKMGVSKIKPGEAK